VKKTVIATIAIWAMGISSAAALVSTLARPPAAKAQLESPVAVPEPPVDISGFKVPVASLVASPAQIVRAQLHAPAKPAKPRDMKCSAFRSMQLGPVDRGVRYCK
jgi:hypothetical protein